MSAPFRIDVKVDGDMRAMMRGELAAGERAVSAAIASRTEWLKADWRGQVTGAGLGQRLANSIRSKTYPGGQPSLDAAGIVWSKAPHIVDAFERGVTIRSASGFWLAIPLPAAGKGRRGGRITPAEWEQRRGVRLRFVRRPGRPGLLVADGRLSKAGLGKESKAKTGRGRATVPIFVLVPQVKLPRRLNLYRASAQAAAALPNDIIRAWRAAR